LVEFFDDVAVNENAVTVITDEAVRIHLDLALLQQQLQF